MGDWKLPSARQAVTWRGGALCLAVLVAVSLLAGASSSAAPQLHPDLEAQNEEVAGLYGEGRYAEGVELARRYHAEWVERLGADSPEACSMAANLGPLLTSAGEYEAAEIAHREAIECLSATFGPDSEELASALNNYGSHLGFTADFGRAEIALRESIRLLRLNLGEGHMYVAITLNNLGINQQNQGNPVAAERTLRDAVARLRTSLGSEHPYTAAAVNNLGRLLVSLRQFEEAEPLLVESLAVRDSTLGPGHSQTAIGHRDLGRLYWRQGRFAEAEEQFRRARVDFEAAVGKEHPDVAMTRHGLGRVLASEGRREEARVEFKAALELFARNYDEGHSSLVQLERELGELDLADGRISDALQRFEAAAQSFETGRNRTGEGLSRATYLDSPWRALAAARLLQGDDEGAWTALEKSMGRVLADVLFPGKTLPNPVDEATALIGWLDIDAGDGPRAWAWSLRGDQVRWHELFRAARFEAAIGSLRKELAEPGAQAELRRAANQVWRQRIAPLEDDLRDVKHLVVIPGSGMLGIPVGALVDDNDRWLADRWTLSYAPSPQVRSWLHGFEARNEGGALFVGDPILPGGDHLAVASRRPTDDVIRGATHGLREDLDRLPPLPGTRAEVLALAADWEGSTVLLGAEASEDAVARLAESDDLDHYRVLHFATHALVDAEDADASALVLSRVKSPAPTVLLASGETIRDGLVTSGEIARDWRLDADLVVLSACNSALGREVVGEGLVGFAHAFLRTGARSVLVSQWSVPDRATLEFMTVFYGAWRGEGLSRAESLAQARHRLRDFRDPDGRRPYRHPYYWAPFVLVGDER